MAFKVWDEVQETTITTGTTDFNLAGAVPNYQQFSDFMSNNDTTYYTAKLNTQWETGIGTYSSGSNSLVRTTVLTSSSSGSKVSFSAGTKTVICGPISAGQAAVVGATL